jgi:hypothetical protein
MESKVTAVEWFMEQIGEKQPNGLYVIDTLEDVVNVFAKAKEIERQHIIDAHKDNAVMYEMDATAQAEQYYTQTFTETKND